MAGTVDSIPDLTTLDQAAQLAALRRSMERGLIGKAQVAAQPEKNGIGQAQPHKRTGAAPL